MTIAHKYIDKSIFTDDISKLAKFFFKLSTYDNSPYECKDSEEKEMMEYFCSIGYAKKSGIGKYLLDGDCPIMNSFCLFLNCLTNKLSMPYNVFTSCKEINSSSLFDARITFQNGIMHGDFLFSSTQVHPYILGIFGEESSCSEPLFLHHGFFDGLEDRDEVFAELIKIKDNMPEWGKDNRYVVYDRRNNTLVFETEEDQKVFEKLFPFWESMPKEYYYKKKESAVMSDIEEYMDNPTPEGAQKIIESLKADFQNMCPDADVTVRILPKSEPLKPVEPENITRMEEEDKKGFTYLLGDESNVATIFKDGNVYCTLFRSYNEKMDCFLIRIKEFIDKMNS